MFVIADRFVVVVVVVNSVVHRGSLMLGLFGCYFMLGVLTCGCLRLCFCIYIAWLWIGWGGGYYCLYWCVDCVCDCGCFCCCFGGICLCSFASRVLWLGVG